MASIDQLAELNAEFGMDGVLRFAEGLGGLMCAEVTTPACAATVFLHGAHLTHWQPSGAEPVIFLSEKSLFAEAKAIRGGVPVIFPWFGARQWAADGSARTDGPQHGFARTASWDVAFAAMVGEELHLTLTLGPSEASRVLGYDGFQLAYELVLGRTLRMRLSVANVGEGPLKFEEALHTYLAVGEAEQLRIEGLGGTEFLDKTDGFKRKRQEADVLTLIGETDRPYLNTEAAVTVSDPEMGRKIVVAKSGSRTTVVWNPWVALAAKLADLGDEEWRRFVCVETANVAEDAVTLQPKEAHVMEARISVEELAS